MDRKGLDVRTGALKICRSGSQSESILEQIDGCPGLIVNRPSAREQDRQKSQPNVSPRGGKTVTGCLDQKQRARKDEQPAPGERRQEDRSGAGNQRETGR